MKDSYRIIGDKVEVKDYDVSNNLDIVTYDYQDNIEDVLNKENELEEVMFHKNNTDNDINEIYNNLKLLEKDKNKVIKKTLLFTFLYYIITKNIDINILINTLNNFIALDITNITYGILFCTIIYYAMSMIGYAIYKKDYNYKLNCLEIEQKRLMEKVEEIKQQLIELKNNKTKNNTIDSNNQFISLGQIEKLRQIRNFILVNNRLSFNLKEYEKYYNEGILDEALGDSFNKQQINIMKEEIKKKTLKK